MTPLENLFNSLRSSSGAVLSPSDERQRALLEWMGRHAGGFADTAITRESLPYLLGMAMNDMFRNATTHLRDDLGKSSILDEVLADPQTSLWANCGDASDFFNDVLDAFGLTCNIVSIWFSKTDGHTLVQFYDEGLAAYVLYDPLYATVFLDASGNPLSLYDVMDLDNGAITANDGVHAVRIADGVAASEVFGYYQSLDYSTQILTPYFRYAALRLEEQASVSNYSTTLRAFPTESGVVSGAWLMYERPADHVSSTARAEFNTYLQTNFSLNGAGRYLLSPAVQDLADPRIDKLVSKTSLLIQQDSMGSIVVYDAAQTMNALGKVESSGMAVAGRSEVAGQIVVAVDDGLGERRFFAIEQAVTTLISTDASRGHLRGWGDFNGDGADELLSGDAQTAYLSTNLGLIDESVAFGGATRFLTSGDLSGDGNLDLLVATSASTLAILSHVGEQWSIHRIAAKLNDGYIPAVVADFNADGTDDLFLLDSQGGLHVWVLHQYEVVGAGLIGAVPAGLTLTGVFYQDVDALPDFLLSDESGARQVLASRGDRYVLVAMPESAVDGAGPNTIRGTFGVIDAGILTSPTATVESTDTEAHAESITFIHTEYVHGAASASVEYAENRKVATTTYDHDSLFAWSQYTDHFDDTGRLAARSTFRDDGARDETLFDALDPATKTTDYYGPKSLLSLRIHARSDGIQAMTHFDPLDDHSWSQYIDTLDAAGCLVSRELLRDDGQQELTTFDPADRRHWSLRVVNTAGAPTTLTSAENDGSREITVFDTTDASSWSSSTDHIDATGRLILRELVRDSGEHERTTYDNDERTAWKTEYIDIEDHAFRLEVVHADGRREDTRFDVGNLASWLSYTNHRTADGTVERQVLVRDSGMREEIDYDDASREVWVKDFIDANGSLYFRESALTDRTKEHTYFDRDSAYTWMSYTDRYTTAGALVWRLVVRDSGASEEINYDAFDQAVWSKRYFQVDGTQYFSEAMLANRSTEYTYFDHNATQSWASYTDRYDADGLLAARSLVRDNGTREQTVFEAGDRSIRTIDYINADGAVWYRDATHADGSQDLTTFNTLGQGSWEAYTNHVVANFIASQEVLRYGGERDHITYDAGNPATRTIDHFDATGLLALRESILDQGEIELTYFDRFDENSWSSYSDHYAGSGQLASREVLRDSGAREVTQHDLLDVHAWSYSVSYYDAMNNLVAQEFVVAP